METWIFSYILMALLCVLSFFQPTRQRMIICLTFSVFQVSHAVASEYFSDIMYYLSDGVFASIVLIGIACHAKPDKFTDRMVMACLASIFINIYGIFIYEISWSATSYDVAFYVLYISIAFIFMQKKGVASGDSDARDSSSFIAFYKCNDLCREIHNEAKK